MKERFAGVYMIPIERSFFDKYIKMLSNIRHELKLKVRDYECDLQGIVNNANYQHYLEHARHEFLLERGISFAQMHVDGIDAVVARLNMEFKTPLRSRDEYICKLDVKKEGIRIVFYQEIYRASDSKLCVKAQVDSVLVQNGRLISSCPELEDKLFAPSDAL
jgi:acyl-CoA thioester hydrolase